jgi:hypothetical protein
VPAERAPSTRYEYHWGRMRVEVSPGNRWLLQCKDLVHARGCQVGCRGQARLLADVSTASPSATAHPCRLRRHAAAPGPPGDSLTSVYGHVIWSDLVAVLSDVIGMGLSSMANEVCTLMS